MIILGLFLTGMGTTLALLDTLGLYLGPGWHGFLITAAGAALTVAACIPKRRSSAKENNQ